MVRNDGRRKILTKVLYSKSLALKQAGIGGFYGSRMAITNYTRKRTTEQYKTQSSCDYAVRIGLPPCGVLLA